MIRLPVLACLAMSVAAYAIGPGDFPAAGPISSDPTNADFLLAVGDLSSKYYNTTGTATAGADFSAEHGIKTSIPGEGDHNGVRIWYVSQSAGYTNALGVKYGSNSQVIFPDSKNGVGFGSYVDLNGGGVVHPDLHFFALTDIIGGTADQLYVGPKGSNPDHTTHLDVDYKSPFSYAGSLWYALALDDQYGGGDRDWNDLRVLVQIHPIAAPEPATLALFAGFLAVGVWIARRRRALLAA